MELVPELRLELLQLVRSLKGGILQRRENGEDLSFLRRNVSARGGKAAGTYTNQIRPEAASGEGVPSTLTGLRDELGECTRCRLSEGRRNIVFGEGCEAPQLIFVGEAPGEEEDRLGRPFVGKAGQLLTRIIEAMGMKRQDVYICNILKCRPPGNRNPLPEEIKLCEPFLLRQIEILQPRIICALGTFAARSLLKTEAPITTLRGNFHRFRGVKLMPTYHPAYLLRNPAAKRQVWDDVQKIAAELI